LDLDSGVPRFNLDGVFAGYIGSCIDVTERKRVDEALRESEEQFRRVFEEGPLGLALVGKNFRFTKVNSALCQMVGYPGSVTHTNDIRGHHLPG
jgi:PAS domain-containing protein